MSRDDEALDEPFVRAAVVAGSAPGTEAAHVLIAWDDLEVIASVATSLLPEVARQMVESEAFGGEIRFVVPDDFLEDHAQAARRLAALEQQLAAQAEASGWKTRSDLPLQIQVQLGLAEGPRR